MRQAILLVVVCAGMAGWAGLAGGAEQDRTRPYPEPAAVARQWQFDFKHEAPRAIAVKDLEGQTRWYWYVTYQVTNHTREERIFVPEFTLASDAGDIMVAGRDVPATVFDAVKALLGNPLLESPVKIVGRLLLGKDHARESVAIWPATGRDVACVRIFVSGLSGEVAVVRHPVSGQDLLVSKSLMLEYDLPGAPKSPKDEPAVFRGQKWVMR